MIHELEEIQSRMRATISDIDNLPSFHDEEPMQFNGSGGISLPEPSSATLPEIEQTVGPIRRTGSPMGREQLAQFVLRERYMEKLLKVFEDLEDLEDVESLELLGGIVKGIGVYFIGAIISCS